MLAATGAREAFSGRMSDVGGYEVKGRLGGRPMLTLRGAAGFFMMPVDYFTFSR